MVADKQVKLRGGAAIFLGVLALLLFAYGTLNNAYFHFDAYGIAPFFAATSLILSGSMHVCCGLNGPVTMIFDAIAATLCVIAIVSVSMYVMMVKGLFRKHATAWGKSGPPGAWVAFIAFEGFVYGLGFLVTAFSAFKALKEHQAKAQSQSTELPGVAGSGNSVV